MTIAVDGSAVSGTGSSSPLVLPGLAVTAGDVVIACVATNGGSGSRSVSSSLTWTLLFEETVGAGMAVWYAIAGSTLTDTISLAFTGASYFGGAAFAISGANTSSPIDADSPVYSGTDPATLSTATANTMIVGWFRQSNTQNPSAGAGFTKLVGANFTLLEYKIVSSAQSSLSITDGSAGDSNGVIAFAINQASGGGGLASLSLRLPRRIFVRR